MNLNYLSYSTIYRYDTHPREGALDLYSSLEEKSFQSRACFFTLFDSFKNHTLNGSRNLTKKGGYIVEVRVRKNIKYKNNTQNHFCLFNKKEIELWIRQLKKCVPFDFEVIVSKEYYTIRISGYSNLAQLKFIFMGLRYLWEFPMNHILKESMMMRKFDNLKDYSLIGIVSMTSNTINVSSGHGLFIDSYYPVKIFSYKDLKELLEKPWSSNVNSLLHLSAPNKPFKDVLGGNVMRYNPKSLYQGVTNKKSLRKLHNEEVFYARFVIYYKKEIEKIIKYLNEH